VEVLLIFEEAVHFRLCLVLGAAVALLNLAGEDLGISVNLIQIVVSELAPPLPDPALQLFPLSLQGLRVHHPSFGPHGPTRDDDARRMPRWAVSVPPRLSACAPIPPGCKLYRSTGHERAAVAATTCRARHGSRSLVSHACRRRYLPNDRGCASGW